MNLFQAIEREDEARIETVISSLFRWTSLIVHGPYQSLFVKLDHYNCHSLTDRATQIIKKNKRERKLAGPIEMSLAQRSLSIPTVY